MNVHAAFVLPSIGKAMVYASTILLIVSAIASALQSLKATNATGVRWLAHISMVLSFLCATIASAILMVLLCDLRFEVAYVAAHTSRDLPLQYRMSAFWAGQEGSMLLWAWFGLLTGVIFIRASNSLGKGAPCAVALLSFAQLFLLVALACKSPFEVLPQRPIDGHGLNPLLRNFWMTIHPPLMFLGYALTSAPYALSFLLLREPEDFEALNLAHRWTMLAWLIIGASIIAGAYWSYEVLGWGGYWGWDPVENASLVPWLLLTAMLHTLAIQRRNGAAKRMGALFSVLTYVSVIYATFITRSGILREVSVHVFAEAHGLTNAIIFIWLIACTAIGAAMLICHWHSGERKPAWTSIRSTNFTLWCAALLLALMACVVELGTSLPLLTKPFGVSLGASPSFYNHALAPMALALLLLLSVNAYYQSGVNARLLAIPLLLGCIAASAAFLFGMRNPFHVAATLASTAAALINLRLLWRITKRNWRHLGSSISHIGISLLMLGVSLSASFERSQTLKLASGQSKTALGHRISCVIESQSGNRAKLTLTVEHGRRRHIVQVGIYDSPYGIVRQPKIRVLPFKDIYASPIELLWDVERAILVLRRGEERRAFGMSIRFVKFDVRGHRFGHEGEFIARAVLEVYQVATGERHTVSPGLTSSGEGVDDSLPDKSATFSILAMNADEGMIRLSVERRKASASSLHAFVELSIKPFMNLLRLSSILILLGGLFPFAAPRRLVSRQVDGAEIRLQRSR